MIGKVLPPSEAGRSYDLPPRPFRQAINPLKQKRVDSPDLPKQSQSQPFEPAPVCFGQFWDNDQKRAVRVFLGTVAVRVPFSYRAAPSSAADFDDEPANILSREFEGAARYEFSAARSRPERSEDAPQAAEKSPGTSVIPGQVIPEYQNHAD